MKRSDSAMIARKRTRVRMVRFWVLVLPTNKNKGIVPTSTLRLTGTLVVVVVVVV